ncbi:hypothetical protein [Sediminibacterium sp.]|jgi:hypothetical protein|uniref:hypothetical protein n=1 Tax=Sediminibacterium sp. TaxID=1917865 RepID=UPI0025CCFB97|nr:hypothetical protein [Sediminibacterium sp.]MBW0178226.1 hypothetical protein [Sediminibacterium sp.]
MRPIFIIIMLVLIAYAIAQGINYGSVTGIILATCSLIALVYAIYLTHQLDKQQVEEAENEYQ